MYASTAHSTASNWASLSAENGIGNAQNPNHTLTPSMDTASLYQLQGPPPRHSVVLDSDQTFRFEAAHALSPWLSCKRSFASWVSSDRRLGARRTNSSRTVAGRGRIGCP